MIKEIFSQLKMYENVEYVLRDRNGNIKPLFQENKIALWLVKRGFLHPHTRLIYIPVVNRLFGHWSTKKVVKNIMTNTGLAESAARWNAATAAAAFNYIALGTGTTAAAAGDTALQTETSAAGLARGAATAQRFTTTVTNDTAENVRTFTNTSAGTVNVSESGVLNASSGGVLGCRQVFTAIPVAVNDSLTTTWRVKHA